MKTFEQFVVESEEYHGEHSAPDPGSGAPHHNLSGVFPDDVYSSHGLRHYGHETGSDESHGHIMRTRNKPERSVKMYRAVPYEKTNAEKISDLEGHKRHVLKHGTIPSGVTGHHKNASAYFEHAHNEIERLSKAPEAPQTKHKINPGDWVTTSRKYAHEHGKSNLNGKYKVLTKTAKAKHLFTDGSMTEWGYHPHEDNKPCPCKWCKTPAPAHKS